MRVTRGLYWSQVCNYHLPVRMTCMGPPGWRSGKGTAAPAVPPETLGSRPGSVVTGRDWEVRGATHNWPSVVRVREGLAGRDILVSSRTRDSCGGPGSVRAVLRSSAAWLGIGGRMTFNLRISRARAGVVAMRQDSSYQTIGYHEIGEKKG